MKPMYKAITGAIVALRNCKASGNNYADKWEECIERFQHALPSGSGLDTGTRIVIDECTDEKLVLVTSYHHMNEHGYYTRWTDHKIVVKPSLMSDFNLTIGGKDYNDIKDYLHEVFDHALREEVNPFPQSDAKPAVTHH
jgi:hypothetical protein